jgi:hypothetical protein
MKVSRSSMRRRFENAFGSFAVWIMVNSSGNSSSCRILRTVRQQHTCDTYLKTIGNAVHRIVVRAAW